MILEMKVPSPGESISEVEIAEWLVETGDYVEKDQAIAEVDSDKATLELPAEVSGTIEILYEPGDVIGVGEVVCKIDTSADAPAKGDKPIKEPLPSSNKIDITPSKESYATGSPSPAAKKILGEKGILASSIQGTGKDGRITKNDAINAKASMGSSIGKERTQNRERMSSLRRKLAKRLVSVKNETAMLTTFNEVDMKPIMDLRKKYKETFAKKHDVGLGFMSFFTLAVVRALKEFRNVASMIDGDDMVSFDSMDISVAVSGPKGLMVPVVRNADQLGFAGIESQIKSLAIKVRDGKITIDEMTGGCFTITNGGVFGSMLSTPIINPPQSAILGMHNIVERPIAVNGKIVIRPIMYVAMSYDHRIIDGKESVGTLVAIKEALENPIDILMQGDVKKGLDL
ncbi:MAG: 2-oxoglutarate dehydrogenase complex dihydrolipoyllysine-residue succinyltransferase [Schleiferiaceae bacterium]|jgi:2-oxoglutarate dehydrogenase E2 component (dihydrolipoamide succinyltransferase)|nr:MAG: dihydrolipoamide succinyltransferase [Owenweeksia sp. TMED14]|tara:strand:- start:26647 stop:27846 length:1200 start_codon:yes stop_codon:yes gene_type:complete